MTRKEFDDGIEELLVAFPKMEMTEKTADVWYKHSRHLLGDSWKKKIHRCITRCYKTVPVLADILDFREEQQDDFYRT